MSFVLYTSEILDNSLPLSFQIITFPCLLLSSFLHFYLPTYLSVCLSLSPSIYPYNLVYLAFSICIFLTLTLSFSRLFSLYLNPSLPFSLFLTSFSLTLSLTSFSLPLSFCLPLLSLSSAYTFSLFLFHYIT